MAAKRSEKPRSATSKSTAEVPQRAPAEAVVGESALAESEKPVESREAASAESEKPVAGRESEAVEREKAVVGREAAMADREAALATREAAMATREAQIAVRERQLIDGERDLAHRNQDVATRTDELVAKVKGHAAQVAALDGQAAALEARAAALEARAAALDARDDEMSIREAAIDEAMSLASEGLQGPVRAADDALFEGPDMPVTAVAPPPPPSPPVIDEAAAARLAAEEERLQAARNAFAEERKRAEQQAGEEHRRLLEEGENFLSLVRTISILDAFVPRVQKAMSGSLNSTVLLAFYNMAVRQLAERLDAAPSEDRMMALEVAVAERQKALDDAKERLTTLKEDFDRHRNRVKNEQETFSTRANEELLRRIVPAVDNFERALAATAGATNVEAILSGVKMIQRQFEDILSQEGLVPVKSVGLPFDPRVHEALMEVAAIDVPDETVVEELQRGYHLGGKLFRPSLVKVARVGAGGGAPTIAPEGEELA